MGEVTYARLRVTDPGRRRVAAVAWRELAAWTGQRAAEFGPHADRLGAAWSGGAATAAVARLAALRRGLTLTRLAWWEADQVLCELADGLVRAKALLVAAVGAAERAGLSVDADGRIVQAGPLSAGQVAVARESGAALAVALQVAARADAVATDRLAALATAVTAAAHEPPVAPPGRSMPACGAAPAEVRRWWDALDPAQRHTLTAGEPTAIGSLDGVPAGARDLANRLLLDARRDEVDRWIVGAHGPELCRLRELRAGLDALAGRLADDAGPRAYLLRLDLAGEGRAVVALGDPDRADNVLTHVPGMTAGLSSLDGELSRAARVAERAQQVAPQESTSAVLWLDYDAPDFLHEAAGAARAEAGAESLRRFQDGLRASHDGPAAHLTVSGHSYGSLVVGAAAGSAGLAADSVVFVGSPGVGVDSAAGLHVPPGQVWSTASASDIVQYAAVAPGGLLADLAVASAVPVFGQWLAFGRPEEDLWFGRNPADPGFGARVFAAQHDAGHLGYFDPGRPALDSLARITLGGAYQEQVG
jgi:hypothetical protein